MVFWGAGDEEENDPGEVWLGGPWGVCVWEYRYK